MMVCRWEGGGRTQAGGVRLKGSDWRVQAVGFRLEGSGLRAQGSGVYMTHSACNPIFPHTTPPSRSPLHSYSLMAVVSYSHAHVG